jgi:hypothetical protein
VQIRKFATRSATHTQVGLYTPYCVDTKPWAMVLALIAFHYNKSGVDGTQSRPQHGSTECVNGRLWTSVHLQSRRMQHSFITFPLGRYSRHAFFYPARLLGRRARRGGHVYLVALDQATWASASRAPSPRWPEWFPVPVNLAQKMWVAWYLVHPTFPFRQ